ncbi:hypothetical protein [Streptomyces umbrinus]|nr:hypothetical protein [Streptomyces umbrinus]
MSTRPWIVDDDMWALIEPLLPPWPEKSAGPQPVAAYPPSTVRRVSRAST